ncbi:MAG: hypothetical protein ACK44H_01670, partial [Candidatus Kryptonium sp.]
MKKIGLFIFLLFISSGLTFSQVRIGWHQSSIEVDAGVSGQQIFVVLNNSYTTQGVSSFQVDITSTNVTIGVSNVALYSTLSSNFNITKSSITNGVRVLVYGKTIRRMFQPGYNSSVLVVTLPSLSAGSSYSVTLSNASTVIRDYPSGANPQPGTTTLSPATISITASTFTPPTSSPTFTPTGYTASRKYGDINWDNSVNVVDVTGLADVLVGNYSAVTVNDPNGSRAFYGGGSDPNGYDGSNPDKADRRSADVYGTGGDGDATNGEGDDVLDLMDLATLDDAVVSGVWPSYAISAIAG